MGQPEPSNPERASRARAPATDPVGEGADVARWSIGVFLFALALRALTLLELAGSATFGLRLGDGRVYHLWAQEIAGGAWLGDEVFYQAPLYPYFLAVVYGVGGDDLLLVRGVQILLGATACGLLVQAGWRLFSKRAGILAGVGLALYAPAIFADVMIQKSVLDVFLVCALLAVMSGLDGRSRLPAFAGLGVAVGALVLTRENALVFAAVLGAWLLLLPSASARRRSGAAAVFVLGVALVLLPVAVRNYVVGDAFHLTTSQFGHNFFIGNNAAADGTYAPLVYGRGDPLVERQDAIDLAARALGYDPTPAEVSRFYTGLALDYIRANPGDWMLLLGRKLLLVSNAVELVDTEDQYTYAESSRVLRWSGAVFHFGVLAPLSCLGLAVTFGRRRALWPLYALVATYVASLLPFYVFARYRLPIVPILLLFAAAGVWGAREHFRGGSRAAVGLAVALIVAAAVVSNWPLSDPATMRSATHFNFGNGLAAEGLADEAMAEYRLAIALDEDNAVANHNLGVMHARRGELGVARRHLERALAIAPRYVDAHVNLARLLVESGEAEAAIASYRRGLEADPVRVDALVELGALHARRGEFALAIAALEQALAVAPDHAPARRALDALRAARPAEAAD